MCTNASARAALLSTQSWPPSPLTEAAWALHVLLALMRLPQSPLTDDSNLLSNFDRGMRPPDRCNNILGRRKNSFQPLSWRTPS